MSSPVATLIGDVVGSKRARDRDALHRGLGVALDAVNAELGPLTPLWVTAGDEYQGCFASVGDALRATLRIRLALRDETEVRHGIGWGDVRVLQQQPRVEDGPGWWAARAAIEEVERLQGRPQTRSARTWYVRASDMPWGTGDSGETGPAADAVNAALALRDELLQDVGAESLSVLAGMLAGMSQKEIAAGLEVTPSAVSQRLRRDGLVAVLRSDELLGRLP